MDELPEEQQTDSGRTPRYQTLRGMHDVLPEDAALYRKVEATLWEMAERHGFQEIRTPILEPTELFTRPLGQGSDIIHKELYSFSDRSDNPVSLRPEGTAGVARAYLEHGMPSWPGPVKLAYLGQNYRYDRPQAGRYREHEQFGLEVFGSDDPIIDAEIILTAWQAYEALGLADVRVQVNSIGSEQSRKAIRKAITETLAPVASQLPEDAQRQLKDNPLRILDSKDPATQEHLATIPPLIDQLTTEDREHFTAVLEYLDEVGVPYELNPHVVRGLDYYTRTVFEFWGTEGSQSSLGSGGRYDRLIETLGGQPTPGVGIGIGIDRIVDHLKSRKGTKTSLVSPSVFVVQLGDVAKKISFKLLNQLTRAGISVTSAQGKDSIRAQLRHADRLRAPLALIIGQKEAMEGSLILRDMASGMQDTVKIDEVVEQVQKRIPRAVTTKNANNS